MSPRITGKSIDCVVHQTSFAEGAGFSETAIQLAPFWEEKGGIPD